MFCDEVQHANSAPILVIYYHLLYLLVMLRKYFSNTERMPANNLFQVMYKVNSDWNENSVKELLIL